MRIAVQRVPAQTSGAPYVIVVAQSLALMVLTILVSVWIAAKIYRVGVLMYGKRPTLPELARWLRYS
jgi:ABC-2 type transport system permease protein